ncbi:MAG: hypothetical protein R3271_01925 [Methylophaga sp.]|uniref:hypothetical protein n=1 Tax=Methylophaga sp. TaxID=2024840 RepID=UPI00299D33FD|nr:hypothetical protein [Methylophaga sp.]MDX1749061.1 hypothetical protein [Methylophaga sp.]
MDMISKTTKKRLPRCLYDGKSKESWFHQFIQDAKDLTDKLDSLADEYSNKSGLHISYQSFLRFFRERNKALSLDEFIIATQFTYGWMPTINVMHGDPQEAYRAFNHLIKDGFDMQGDKTETHQLFENLIPATNNSLVGASKLLHFACPGRYAIWDSQVFRYFYPESTMASNQLNQLDRYLQYHALLADLSADPKMKQTLGLFRRQLIQALPKAFQMDLVLTHYRCIEFVMHSTSIVKARKD